MKTRQSTHITDPKEIEYIISLTEHDLLSLSTMLNLFGTFKGKSRFRTYDTFTCPAGAFGPEGKKNKKPFVTTVGKYVFNKIYTEGELFEHIGYTNEIQGKKGYKNMLRKISHLVLEEKLPLDALKNFLNKNQKLMPLTTPLMENETEAMYVIAQTLEPKKQELLKKYKKEIDTRDQEVISKIEKEMLDYAKDIMKDDPSLDMYNTGVGGDYGNNFKNLYIMKGLSKDPDPNKGYNFISGSYVGGITKEEFPDLANSLAEGPYARARKTAFGGYLEKLCLKAYQHIVLDEPGSDCGTKRTIDFTITKGNIDYIMYSYIVEGNKLVELTSENESKYIGKTVKIRFASLCENKDHTKICSKCAGNKMYRIGIKNIGCCTSQAASKLKNLNMKSFHDSQVVYSEMNVMEAFFPYGKAGIKTINEDANDNGIETIPIEESVWKHQGEYLTEEDRYLDEQISEEQEELFTKQIVLACDGEEY